MEFARFVLENPAAQEAVHGDRTFRDYALTYLAEFGRALAVHDRELTDDGVYATFRFIRPVPVTDRSLAGSPLPVNMNAGFFTAMLHASRAAHAAGQQPRAERLRRRVERFVNYLDAKVLVRRKSGGRTYLVWDYATYANRAEDVGHSNLVAKFLHDAHQDGYRVRRGDLVALANTYDRLLRGDGTVTANLLDRTSIPGVEDSAYYLVLTAKYSPSLEAKLEALVMRSRAFAQWGPWTRVAQDRAARR
jgi:hypothetical protein